MFDVIFRIVFWERSDCGPFLQSLISPICWPGGLFVFGDVISEGQSSLQTRTKVCGWWTSEPVVKLKLQWHFTGTHFHLNDVTNGCQAKHDSYWSR